MNSVVLKVCGNFSESWRMLSERTLRLLLQLAGQGFRLDRITVRGTLRPIRIAVGRGPPASTAEPSAGRW